MVRFIIIYSIVAVFGSVVVFVSVPMIKSNPLPPVTDTRAVAIRRIQRVRKKEKITAAKKAEVIQVAKQTVKVEPEIGKASEFQSESLAFLKKKEWDSAIKATLEGLKHYPDNATLLTLKKRAEARGQKWAVVWKDNTPIYNLSGKRLRTVPTGTLLQIKTTKDTASGQLFIADVSSGEDTLKDVLIKPTSLTYTEGILDNVDSSIRNLMVAKADLMSKIYTIEKEHAEKMLAQNPHTEPFKKAKDEYSEFSIRVKELISKRDAASGDERIKYGDELRNMQAESLRLKQKYSQTKKAYTDYKEKRISIPESPSMNEHRDDLSEIENKLKSSGISIN